MKSHDINITTVDLSVLSLSGINITTVDLSVLSLSGIGHWEYINLSQLAVIY